MTLDKYTNLKKIVNAVFEKIWGPQYPVICPKSDFQLLRGSIPSTQKLENEINFFHLGDTSSKRVSTQAGDRNTSHYYYFLEYKFESNTFLIVYYY